MTRTILMGCLAMAMVAGLTANKAMAQDASKPAVKKHEGGGPFAKLNLTDDQKAKIKAIREDAREKVRTVLTEEQRKQLMEKFVARRHKVMAKVGEKLGLTDDQKAQIKTIMEQAHKDAKAATDKAEKAKIMQAAREKIRTTVLTEEQRKKAEEFKNRVKEHRKGRGGDKPKATT